MRQPTRHQWTYGEYLAHEAACNTKNEFLDGEIYAMAGGSFEHAALAAAIIGALHGQLRGRCRAYTSDLSVRVADTGLTAYPDVTIICGEPEQDPEDARTATNPRVIFEVLSPSTEAFDRGEKLPRYQQCPSVQEVILVAQDRPCLELWRRLGSQWERYQVGPGQTIDLSSLGVQLSVDAIYEGIVPG